MKKLTKGFFSLAFCAAFALVAVFVLSDGAAAQQKKQEPKKNEYQKKDKKGAVKGNKKGDRDDKKNRYDNGSPHHSGRFNEFGFYDFLKENLGLSEEQVRSVFDINQKYRAERFKVREDKEKVKQLFEDERAEIYESLTPEQKKAWEDFHAKRENHHDRRQQK